LSKIYHIINETTRKPLEHPAMLGVLDSPIVGLDKHTLLVSRSGMGWPIEDGRRSCKWRRRGCGRDSRVPRRH
jgi:hypothetical protein